MQVILIQIVLPVGRKITKQEQKNQKQEQKRKGKVIQLRYWIQHSARGGGWRIVTGSGPAIGSAS